ncbi:carbon-nitrogen hydrolase family protein [Yoonia sp.]|jgi:predicted amidohydrolase|uniref:carbon-nitrogen hydrolase family protein n=1 Tax=Yoonia sp. TaxID=2212373 RepID=UPI0025F110D8|nr:carbon-nitrogen hydrolase family protein [Yoonia sp.]
MKIAAAAYHPQWHDDWAGLTAKRDHWVRDAATQGAALLVFSEYAGIEAALIGAPDGNGDPRRWRDGMVAAADRWAALHRDLAMKYNVTILAGSLNAQGAGGLVNRAMLCGPGGDLGFQDKMILTPYERLHMSLAAGQQMQLFDTAVGRVGVLICYDSEFPLLARALMAAGADMILVPSCTEQVAGQTRVRQSCRARAIEGQCLIVQAPLVGAVPGCDIVALNTGRAGLFCPPDYGLPADGIIAQGVTDMPGWVIADVAPTGIAAARATGQVGNFAHWVEQDDRIKTVTSVTLR